MRILIAVLKSAALQLGKQHTKPLGGKNSMNVLFLTMSPLLARIEESGIYTDLMRKFKEEGHNVFIVYPLERRHHKPTELREAGGIRLLGVRTLNVVKTNIIEKGIGQVLLEYNFHFAIKRHFKAVSFDLILYSTPPIMFTWLISTLKRSNPQALCYLLLKDIFPQNAVDLGLLSDRGWKSCIYKWFRRKEKKLYRLSDFIGCMSPANVKYVLKHNPEIPSERVEIAPNSYDLPPAEQMDADTVKAIRKKYGLPPDKPIFIYGGNIGKPQGGSFIIECLKAVKDRQDCYFVVIGDGTEYAKLDEFVQKYSPKAVALFKRIPKADYDTLTHACDVGLIFLDYRFTIPNYPSRLLPYLTARKPVIAATDPNCDTGTIAEANGYGFYCPSNSVERFVETIDRMLAADRAQMGASGYRFYLDNYTTEHTYQSIVKHL